MIKIENVEVHGWDAAIRGMRNPMNSWAKSDSSFGEVGEADLALMKKLFNAGTEHRKYLRMVNITMDLTAPLYWWKEWDTMKVGTVCNSCSTMHKIAAKRFELDDFSHEHLSEYNRSILARTIQGLNDARNKYTNYGASKDDWWQLIQLLPSSYNQRRTVQINYEVVATILRQRSNHKLDEWRELVSYLKTLPYVKEIMLDDAQKNDNEQ